MDVDDDVGGLSRRQVIARGAAVAGVAGAVWAAPIIRSTAAYATSQEGTEQPCTKFFIVVIDRGHHWPYFPQHRPHFPPGWSPRGCNRNDRHWDDNGHSNGVVAPTTTTTSTTTTTTTRPNHSHSSRLAASSTPTSSSTSTTTTSTTTPPTARVSDNGVQPLAAASTTQDHELPTPDDFGKLVGTDLPDPQPTLIMDWVQRNPGIDFGTPDVFPQITQTGSEAWAILLPEVTGPNAGARQCRLITAIYKNGCDFGAEGYVDPNPPNRLEAGRRIICPTRGGGHGGYTGHDGRGPQPGHSHRPGNESIILIFCCP